MSDPSLRRDVGRLPPGSSFSPLMRPNAARRCAGSSRWYLLLSGLRVLILIAMLFGRVAADDMDVRQEEKAASLSIAATPSSFGEAIIKWENSSAGAAPFLNSELLDVETPDDDAGGLTVRVNSSVQRASFEELVTLPASKQFASANNSSGPFDVMFPSPAFGSEKPRPPGNVMLIPTASRSVSLAQHSTVRIPPGHNLPAQTSSAGSDRVDLADVALTPEIVATRRAAAEQTPDLSDDVKAQLLKHFQRATELLTQKADLETRTAELKSEMENGPALIAEYRALLTQPPPKSEPEFPPTATVAELDQLRLIDEEKAVEALRNLDAWETKAKNRTDRKPQMPSLIETTRQQLEEVEQAVVFAAPEGEVPSLAIARHTEQEALILLLRSQLECFRVEQVRNESLNECFPLQRDVLTRAHNSAEKRAELWKIVLTDARREESARQALEAREKLRNAHPTLRDLAEKNSSLTLRRKEVQDFLALKVADLAMVNTTLANVEQKFQSITEKEQRAGLSTAVGLLLRSQRAHLPHADEFHDKQRDAEQDLIRLQAEQMLLEDERSGLGDIEVLLESTLSRIAVENVSDNDLRVMTLELLTDRRLYLDDLLADYDSCVHTLGETDVACRRLQSLLHDYERYIDERVLWIRSAPGVEFGFLRRSLVAARSFVSHRQWMPIWSFLIRDAYENWPLYGLFVVGFGLILGLTRRIRRFVADLGGLAEKQMDSVIPLALLATALTVVMASAWPALLWFFGWRLSNSELQLGSALSGALMFSAAAVWIVDSFRVLCRKNGVAVSFLEWPRPIVRSLHANLLLYLAVGVPLSFIVVSTGTLDEGIIAETAGRLAFVTFCVLLAMILRRLVRPTGPAIGDLLRSNPNSLMHRLRWLWYPIAVGSPLSLAVLALMGYQYTSEQLMVRLQLTLGLSFVLVISYTMVMQWMLAARRSLAQKQDGARQAAALAVTHRETAENGSVTIPILPIELPHVDLSLLNQQMLRLIHGTACIVFLTISWGIWWQVLPALQVFSRIELWQVVLETTEPLGAATEGTGLRVITRVESVTLGHLLFGLVAFSAAILASRNLPGLLELAVLQRLPLDHGGRHAITTLCRYSLLLAGVVVACNLIGIDWGSVQWLVAALTVGLGFGLQEIFANFVSGLIILFERPVRIGDLVTIDSVSGCVSKIQIRATTITDWDRKEYIVPNKEFVTGKVLNWTLSDKTNRIVINVGVAYGSDTELALELLSQIANDHPLILKDPAPVIGIEKFGESGLNLVLRCYLPNFDHRLKVITQLHVTIDHRFREAGIDIAFPQRDAQIRNLLSSSAVASARESSSAETSTPTSGDGSPLKKRSA